MDSRKIDRTEEEIKHLVVELRRLQHLLQYAVLSYAGGRMVMPDSSRGELAYHHMEISESDEGLIVTIEPRHPIVDSPLGS